MPIFWASCLFFVILASYRFVRWAPTADINSFLSILARLKLDFNHLYLHTSENQRLSMYTFKKFKKNKTLKLAYLFINYTCSLLEKHVTNVLFFYPNRTQTLSATLQHHKQKTHIQRSIQLFEINKLISLRELSYQHSSWAMINLQSSFSTNKIK